MSLSAEAAERGAADEMSLKVEGVVDGGVDGDEALCRSGRFEGHLPTNRSPYSRVSGFVQSPIESA